MFHRAFGRPSIITLLVRLGYRSDWWKIQLFIYGWNSTKRKNWRMIFLWISSVAKVRVYAELPSELSIFIYPSNSLYTVTHTQKRSRYGAFSSETNTLLSRRKDMLYFDLRRSMLLECFFVCSSNCVFFYCVFNDTLILMTHLFDRKMSRM